MKKFPIRLYKFFNLSTKIVVPLIIFSLIIQVVEVETIESMMVSWNISIQIFILSIILFILKIETIVTTLYVVLFLFLLSRMLDAYAAKSEEKDTTTIDFF